MSRSIDLEPRRPLTRYHGSKWRIAPRIIEFFPQHRVYVEPFGGGGSVLLRKPRSYAEIYNDLDLEIVNLFKVARDHGQELQRVLELTPYAREELAESYAPAADPIEGARRTVVRAFMGFGSASMRQKADGSPQHTGFRCNSNKSGTTPAHDWNSYPAAMPAIIERLRGVVIENRDACEVMEQHDAPTTLHYVDPPYVHSTRSLKAGKGNLRVYRHEMTDADHATLAARLKGLVGTVVLSGYPCPLYDRLYADWIRHEFRALADGSRERTEVLWINRETADLFKGGPV